MPSGTPPTGASAEQPGLGSTAAGGTWQILPVGPPYLALVAGSTSNVAGKVKKAGRQTPSSHSAPTQYVVGSEAHRGCFCDASGVTHGDDSLDIFTKVDSKMALRSDLISTFGPEEDVCHRSMFSNLYGKGRFILCNHASDPKHKDHKASAHRNWPKDYKQTLRQLFR